MRERTTNSVVSTTSPRANRLAPRPMPMVPETPSGRVGQGSDDMRWIRLARGTQGKRKNNALRLRQQEAPPAHRARRDTTRRRERAEGRTRRAGTGTGSTQFTRWTEGRPAYFHRGHCHAFSHGRARALRLPVWLYRLQEGKNQSVTRSTDYCERSTSNFFFFFYLNLARI